MKALEYKKLKIDLFAKTKDIRQYDKKTGNFYKSIVIMSKRADQISLEIKDEMQKEIQEVAPATDSLEEVFENREQIEVAKQYERLPKPTSMAIKEFEDGKIHFKLNNPQEEENA